MSEPLDARTLDRLAVTTAWSKRPRRADMACAAVHEIEVNLGAGTRRVTTHRASGARAKPKAPVEPVKPTIPCAFCGELFERSRPDRRYCDDICRKEANNAGLQQPQPAAAVTAATVGRMRQIQAIVAGACGTPPEEMTGPSHKVEVARPRMIAMVLCRALKPRPSLPQIGRIFGDRDHTTVRHAIIRVARLRDTDPDFAALYAKAAEACRAALEVE